MGGPLPIGAATLGVGAWANRQHLSSLVELAAAPSSDGDTAPLADLRVVATVSEISMVGVISLAGLVGLIGLATANVVPSSSAVVGPPSTFARPPRKAALDAFLVDEACRVDATILAPISARHVLDKARQVPHSAYADGSAYLPAVAWRSAAFLGKAPVVGRTFVRVHAVAVPGRAIGLNRPASSQVASGPIWSACKDASLL